MSELLLLVRRNDTDFHLTLSMYVFKDCIGDKLMDRFSVFYILLGIFSEVTPVCSLFKGSKDELLHISLYLNKISGAFMFDCVLFKM